MLKFYEKLDLGAIFDFRIFEKAPFGNHFRPQKLHRSSTPVEGERPFRDPAFHETIIITVPLGHVGF